MPWTSFPLWVDLSNGQVNGADLRWDFSELNVKRIKHKLLHEDKHQMKFISQTVNLHIHEVIRR